MAAPSKPWTPIIDGKIDADSPVNEDLKTFERDNGVHSDERIGVPVAAANRQANHAHLGLGRDGSALISLGDRIIFKDEIVALTQPTGSFTDLDVSDAIVPNQSEIEMQWFDDSASALNDITANLQHNDGVAQSGLLGEAVDWWYVGADRIFGEIIVDMETARSGQGAIIAEYFDGVGFASQPSVTDGTVSGGDTLAQDGKITFPPQSDWAVGAQAAQAGLDSSLFFMRFRQTNDPSGTHTIDQGVPKIDTAKIAIIKVRGTTNSGGNGRFEWRKDGTTAVQVTIGMEAPSGETLQFRGVVEVPLVSEIVEHSESTLLSIQDYDLVGFKV